MEEKTKRTSDPWVSQPEIIRKFLDLRPKYEDLCREVDYILSKRIKEAGIEISNVTNRAKTLNSFLEKLELKSYQEPFDEITDFAGVRVVCLYRDDIVSIEKIVGEEFEIVEKVDKLTEKEPDQFGYGAIHYIIRLGRKLSGARYDDLKDLVCEVQVRTVLQDAWAIIDHHLVYKREAAVPKTLQRKLNSLSGLFETADDQFLQIRDKRLAYVEKVRDSKKDPKQFLQTELNLDSFKEYLQWKFPDHPTEAFDGQLGINLNSLQSSGYQILADLENDLDENILAQSPEVLNEIPWVAKVGDKFPSSSLIMCALLMVNHSLAEGMKLTPEQRKVIEKYYKE